MRGGRFCNLHDLLIGWSSTIVNLTIQTLRSAKHRQTIEQSLQKIPKVSTVSKGKRYAFPKKYEEQLLGVIEEVFRHKRRNHPLRSYTFNKGYLPIPSKVNKK